MGVPASTFALISAALPFVMVLLPPLVLSVALFRDATERAVARRYSWAGGVLLAALAPFFGAYVVCVVYFLVNRGEGERVRSTGYLVVALGVVEAVLVVPYAVLYAADPLLAVFALLPVVVTYLVWRRFG